MDDASRLSTLLGESLVPERDIAFAAAVRQRALSHKQWRVWSSRAVRCAGFLALALLLEEMHQAALPALAQLAATADHSLLVQAPLGLALAAMTFFVAGLASTRL